MRTAPLVRATRYEVNAYPDIDSDSASYFTITVEWRGPGRWAVCRNGFCLGKRGQWSYERQSSSRTDRWLKAYRHDLDTALKLAKRAAPKVRINGHTIADVWAAEQAQAAGEAKP